MHLQHCWVAQGNCVTSHHDSVTSDPEDRQPSAHRTNRPIYFFCPFGAGGVLQFQCGECSRPDLQGSPRAEGESRISTLRGCSLPVHAPSPSARPVLDCNFLRYRSPSCPFTTAELQRCTLSAEAVIHDRKSMSPKSLSGR
jgi:hypothetical protein